MAMLAIGTMMMIQAKAVHWIEIMGCTIMRTTGTPPPKAQSITAKANTITIYPNNNNNNNNNNNK
jgi:hypothetical protein